MGLLVFGCWESSHLSVTKLFCLQVHYKQCSWRLFLDFVFKVTSVKRSLKDTVIKDIVIKDIVLKDTVLKKKTSSCNSDKRMDCHFSPLAIKYAFLKKFFFNVAAFL